MFLSVFTMSCMWPSVYMSVHRVSSLSYVFCVVLGNADRRDE